MAEKAIDAGADIIKHQTHIVTDEMTPDAKKVIPAHTNESFMKLENFL